MKMNPSSPTANRALHRRVRSGLGALLGGLLCLLAHDALQAANIAPPEKLTYQGFLTDALGAPIDGEKVVTFRIYSASTGGDLQWEEVQTVTVDNGHFSVLLGEGSAGDNNVHGTLSDVFNGVTASDRYMELTVADDSGGTGEYTLSPRMRYLPTPYAMLALRATEMVDSNGDAVISTGTSGITINSEVTINSGVTATSFTGSGAGLTALSASAIATGTLNSSRLPAISGGKISNASLHGDKLTVGTLSGNRLKAKTITKDKIADNTITKDQIAAGAVGESEIAADAVGASEMADNAVGTDELIDGQVTAEKLASGMFVAKVYTKGSDNDVLFTGEAVNDYFPVLMGVSTGKGDIQEKRAGETFRVQFRIVSGKWIIDCRARRHSNPADWTVQVLWIPAALVAYDASKFK